MPGPSAKLRAWRGRVGTLRQVPAAVEAQQQAIEELRAALDAVTEALTAQQETTEAIRRRWSAVAQGTITAGAVSTDPRCTVVETVEASPGTPYVVVAGSGVRFNPAWFAAAADHLDRHPELAAVYGDAVELGAGYELWTTPAVLDEDTVLAHDLVDLPAVVLRSALLPLTVPAALTRPDRWVLLTALRTGGVAALPLPACATTSAERVADETLLRRLWAEGR